MSKLSRIFYIYTEAHIAVFMLFLAVLEFICYLVLSPEPFAYFALAASGLFVLVANANVLYIAKQERKYK